MRRIARVGVLGILLVATATLGSEIPPGVDRDQYLEAATRVTRTNEARRADFTRQVREEHQAIVAAIRAGDALAARNAAQNHMYNAARRLSQLGQDEADDERPGTAS